MTTQDNTLKMLGFIYQAFIALMKCLEMNENDKVVIEKLGDVTLISAKSTSEQIEVKHHLEMTTISDRSHEIWNTIYKNNNQ
jgi:antitoxin component of MazEF toxin-antitoxin module